MSPRSAAVIVLTLLACAPAQAAQTWTVTRADDVDGTCTLGSDCSLRQAVNSATSGDSISIPAGTYPLTAPLTVDQDLTLAGVGAALTTISGGDKVEILDLGGAADPSISVSGLTLAHGHASDDTDLEARGGAAYLDQGRFTFTEDEFDSNVADGYYGAAGGAIFVSDLAHVAIERSGFDSDGAGAWGEADGGAVYNAGDATIVNSTISDSELWSDTGFTRTYGGGIETEPGATLALTNDTLRANSAESGGNIYADGAPGSVTVKNTMITEGEGQTLPASVSNCVQSPGAITSLGGNLESADQCGLGAAELHDTSPPLAQTNDPETGLEAQAFTGPSPAIRGTTGCPPTDEVGTPRPEACTIGAYEPVPATVRLSEAPRLAKTGDTVKFLVWSPNASPSNDAWTWTVDGAPATGATRILSWTFTTPGTHTVTASGSDRLGLPASGSTTVEIAERTPAPQPPVSAPSKPVIDALLLYPDVFRAAPAPALRSSKAPTGSEIYYDVSARASVKFTFDRAVRGRRTGSGCGRETKKNRRAKACVRWIQLGPSLGQSVEVAGPVSLAFDGRLGNTSLVPGRYRVTVVATGTSSLQSQPARATFRIVR